MSPETAEILTWDLGHLSLQQENHLHALKSQAHLLSLQRQVAEIKKRKEREAKMSTTWFYCRQCTKVLPYQYQIYGFCNAACFSLYKEVKEQFLEISREAFNRGIKT